MNKYTVRGPGEACSEINAANLQEAMEQVRRRYPNMHVAADASEQIYVCQQGEDETSCQMNLIQ